MRILAISISGRRGRLILRLTVLTVVVLLLLVRITTAATSPSAQVFGISTIGNSLYGIFLQNIASTGAVRTGLGECLKKARS